MEHLLSSKQVEPNESLGKAIKYMLRHWEKLTRFLQVPGAPIHGTRMKNTHTWWLFYKTEYGAMVGGVLTSIIYTCELAGANPFDYLVALQVYKDHIFKEPSLWLPWNYQYSKQSLGSAIAAKSLSHHKPEF